MANGDARRNDDDDDDEVDEVGVGLSAGGIFFAYFLSERWSTKDEGRGKAFYPDDGDGDEEDDDDDDGVWTGEVVLFESNGERKLCSDCVVNWFTVSIKSLQLSLAFLPFCSGEV